MVLGIPLHLFLHNTDSATFVERHALVSQSWKGLFSCEYMENLGPDPKPIKVSDSFPFTLVAFGLGTKPP